MNTQMFLVVVTFLTAATLALGGVPNAPSSVNAPSPILTASAPPNNPGVNPNQQQMPGQPGLVPDGNDSDDLKADGFFWGGYGGYYGGGWGGWGRGYYGGYPYGGYRYRPYYGGYGWY